MRIYTLILLDIIFVVFQANAAPLPKECENLKRASTGLQESFNKFKGLGNYATLSASQRGAAEGQALEQAKALKKALDIVSCDDSELKDQVATLIDKVLESHLANETWRTGLKTEFEESAAGQNTQACQKPFEAYMNYVETLEKATSCTAAEMERLKAGARSPASKSPSQ